MDTVDKVIEYVMAKIPEDKQNDKAEIVRLARQESRITCRELSAVSGLKISQISNIEHGRLAVSDDVFTALFMICCSKMVVQREVVSA
jgi:ribosome-binding protein aMBF1 (putative translation factor)